MLRVVTGPFLYIYTQTQLFRQWSVTLQSLHHLETCT